MENREKKSSAKQAAAKGEAGFCVVYLLFAFICGAYILAAESAAEHARAYIIMWGFMTLLLAAGDSFHLVPRILKVVKDERNVPYEKYDFWAGLGLMVSSITMTIFYYWMYHAWNEMFADCSFAGSFPEGLLKICVLLRIMFCLFPQNNWFKKEGNATWSILRNVPFVIIGIEMMVLFAVVSMWSMTILIFISFACYLPVVLFAKKNPKVGMLMMPKTVAYMGMIIIGIVMM